MTGNLVGMAPCFGCGRLFAFDVDKVPSYNGQPVCRTCVDRANLRRPANGLPPITVLPGAYLEDDRD